MPRNGGGDRVLQHSGIYVLNDPDMNELFSRLGPEMRAMILTDPDISSEVLEDSVHKKIQLNPYKNMDLTPPIPGVEIEPVIVDLGANDVAIVNPVTGYNLKISCATSGVGVRFFNDDKSNNCVNKSLLELYEQLYGNGGGEDSISVVYRTKADAPVIPNIPLFDSTREVATDTTRGSAHTQIADSLTHTCGLGKNSDKKTNKVVEKQGIKHRFVVIDSDSDFELVDTDTDTAVDKFRRRKEAVLRRKEGKKPRKLVYVKSVDSDDEPSQTTI